MFIEDKEKMRDFLKIGKDEFLRSYSYLTEEEALEFVEYLNKRSRAVSK